MPDGKSEQLVRVDAQPPQKIEAHEDGKVYRKWFTYTVTALSANVVGDELEAFRMLAGSRLMGGRLLTDGLSSAGGVAGADVGDGTVPGVAKYGAALDLDLAGNQDFGDTLALNHGELLLVDQSIVLTVTGEDWLIGQQLNGYIDYLKLG